MRLTQDDLDRLDGIQRYFASLPVPVRLKKTDCVRAALENLVEVIGVGHLPPSASGKPTPPFLSKRSLEA